MEATNKKYIRYGQRLKSFRKNRGITRREFAENVGCTERTLDRWEAGLSYPIPVFKGKINNILLKLAMKTAK